MAMSTPFKSGIWYLAGPMSNIPQFNYPAFYRIAKQLREMGYTIQSPAELDTPEQQAVALASTTGAVIDMVKSGLTWGDTLAKDVKLVSDVVDGIIAMPTWYKSRGARLEVFVATLCNKPVWIVYEKMDSDILVIRPLDPVDYEAGVLGFGKKEKQKPMEATAQWA